MASSVKQKIRLGTLFLFFLVLLSSGVGIFHLARLKHDSREILKDNYESLQYGHSLLQLMPSFPDSNSLVRFDTVLSRQEDNITEPGEMQPTENIRRYFEDYRSGDTGTVVIHRIQQGIQLVLAANMKSIERKNANATDTANKALTYITLLAAVIFLVGLTFTYNFPSVVTAPVNILIEGIREIGKKNYGFRIHLDRKDEFGQMATAFNQMAERVEYFESSNLNKIIFEKTRAEAVINSLREASIGIDRDGIILFANNQALQLLGLTAADLVGSPVDELAKQNDLLRFLMEDKGTMPFKVVVDDHENYFTREEMQIEQDGAASRVIILRNITSFKELDVARTNLIATISHELKTPLASSDFSLRLLEDERIGNLSDEQQELVGNLRLDNQRMLRILSELLNMSQVEAGRIQLEISESDPVKIMEAALAAVSSAANEKNLIWKRMVGHNLPPVKADAEKTGWVLINLLTNAIKHSPEGSEVTIALEHSPQGHRFSVSDKGPGIPAEYSGKVFDRFFKVPGSKTAGNGLGLAISKEFIEAQGGSIWFTSEPGTGSTFGFTL